jgi:transposase
MGAVRPQTPHRSPRQAFGGNSGMACLRQALEGNEGLAHTMEMRQISAPMNANTLFGMALGIGNAWKVVNSELNVETNHLTLWLDFEPGVQFACPECEDFCPVHDTVEKKWRHLDFWQHQTTLVARVPRTNCEEHGVLQAQVPWARPGTGFTLMMEAMILLRCQQATVSAVARDLRETDKRLWRVLDHYVTEAHAVKDWSQVRRIMIDETSTKKGHNYATNFMDADTKELLFTTQGKDQQCLAAFAHEMALHGATPGQVTEIVMDMSRAFEAGARCHFPQARLVFDHFHLMKAAGDALDRVRKDLAAAGADLAGSIWSIRGNEWTRTQEQLIKRQTLIQNYPILGRAMGLRECLQDMLSMGGEEGLRHWCAWADRSRLAPFRKLSRTIKAHWQGIIAFMETRLTNAAMEAVNGILQIAKRMARGFRNFHYFRIAAYLKAGGLQLNVPHI